MKKLLQVSLLSLALASLPLFIPLSAANAASTSFASRLQGEILLQVQSHGEAWYVDPKDQKRYYMKDGATAYQMMRSFGQGISEADFAKANTGNTSILKRIKGLIVLRVALHGEAYYVNPKTLTLTYLQDGAAAYALMRSQGQGITNSDLEQIGIGSVPTIVTSGTPGSVPSTGAGADITSPPAASTSPSVDEPAATNPSTANSSTSSPVSTPSQASQTPMAPAMQTIPGITGLILAATPNGSTLNVSVGYSDSSELISDSDAYSVPVTGHVSVYLEGFNHTTGEVVKGQLLLDRALSATDITRDSTGLPLIQLSRNDILKDNPGANHYGIVQVTINTPSQGSFVQSLNDVLLPTSDQLMNTYSFNASTEINSTVFLDGTNEYRTADFFLEPGTFSLQANNSGQENFIVYLEDQDGIKNNLLVNEIGPGGYQDSDTVMARGWYHLEVQSDGTWQAELNQKIQ